LKVAIYVRVSTEERRGDEREQAKQQEFENQLIQLREFASKSNWTIVEEYAERMTGTTGARPELKRMLAAARNKEFDVLLFWSLDRLSREGVLPTLRILHDLTAWGVKYRSHREPFLDTLGPWEDAIVSIMATLAALEVEKIRSRTVAGLQRAKAEGKHIGRRRVVFDKQKVLDLREQGLGYDRIAKRLGLKKTTIQRFIQGLEGKA
jgi:DNA invertase Pin-like site-specific DNA recombinase